MDKREMDIAYEQYRAECACNGQWPLDLFDWLSQLIYGEA